jgi:acetyl esterase
MPGHFRTVLVFGLITFPVAVGCNKAASDREKSGPPTPQDTYANRPDERQGERGSNSVTSAQPNPAATTEQAPAKQEDPMADLDKDMKAVLDELATLGAKPIESLTPAEARKQPTLANAVEAVQKKWKESTAPVEVAKVQNRTIPGASGTMPARIYTPKEGKAPYPVIVYFHGGGFVIGSNDSYDATPRGLANGAEAVVVSVDYRKAPENKFPAAHDDAYAAYTWVLKNAASFSGDPRKIAVAGESAGGNLAANVAIEARDKQQPLPLHLLLVYPVASSDMGSEAYVKYATAKPLNRAMMTWFTDKYFRTPADAKDPRIDLIHANLVGLPPTTIVNAEIDPLLSDGKELAKKLEDAKVEVKQKTYSGVTHEFFSMGAVVGEAKDAMKFASGELKDAFSKGKEARNN